jgi:hypothetical protein
MKKLLLLALLAFGCNSPSSIRQDDTEAALITLDEYRSFGIQAHWEYVHNQIGSEGTLDSTVGDLQYRSYPGKGDSTATAWIVWEPNIFNVNSQGMVKAKSQWGLTN